MLFVYLYVYSLFTHKLYYFNIKKY